MQSFKYIQLTDVSSMNDQVRALECLDSPWRKKTVRIGDDTNEIIGLVLQFFHELPSKSILSHLLLFSFVLSLAYLHLFHFIAFPNCIHYLQSLLHFPKYRVPPIQVRLW